MKHEYTCGFCEKGFTPKSSDDIHRDDSGDYHIECYDDWVAKEMSYYRAEYEYQKRVNPIYDNGGYAWGDPKNTDYLDTII